MFPFPGSRPRYKVRLLLLLLLLLMQQGAYLHEAVRELSQDAQLAVHGRVQAILKLRKLPGNLCRCAPAQ